jgi:KDO2-lipid IV(A) lauroyltransferase
MDLESSVAGLERDDAMAELTQKFTTKIEDLVRRFPEHWMWVHRRWKWKGP